MALLLLRLTSTRQMHEMSLGLHGAGQFFKWTPCGACRAASVRERAFRIARHVPAPAARMLDFICDNLLTVGAGSKFYLLDTESFARDVLPLFFKHNRYSSFVRQLNLYGAARPAHMPHSRNLILPVLDTSCHARLLNFSVLDRFPPHRHGARRAPACRSAAGRERACD